METTMIEPETFLRVMIIKMSLIEKRMKIDRI